MNACEMQIRTKWIVIPVWSAPLGVTHINWKLPAHVGLIRGIAFTQSEYEGEFSQERIGELSLQMNDKLTHPLNYDIRKQSKLHRLDKAEIKLHQPICGGTNVTGYYKNLTDKEHKLSLYLHCVITQ
jgi:hypothetical protein